MFQATKTFDEVNRVTDLQDGERTVSIPKEIKLGIKEPAAPNAATYANKPLKGVRVEYVYRVGDRLYAWLSDNRGVPISGGTLQDCWCVTG